MLNTVRYDGPEGPPEVLIAHGLFGSARNWGAIAKRLSATRRVSVVDMRNHGESFWDSAHGYEDMAGDLAASLKPGGDLVGHSMGGKAAMVMALSRPDMLRRLVVADIAPVSYAHTQMHLIDAMRELDLSVIETRGDADRQLADLIEEDAVRAFLLQSLDVRERRWRLNLDALAEEMDKVLSFPDVEGRFDGPALFLSGEASDYVLPEHRERIKTLFPQAQFARIPGAGHWLHAEKPREFLDTVTAFLDA